MAFNVELRNSGLPFGISLSSGSSSGSQLVNGQIIIFGESENVLNSLLTIQSLLELSAFGFELPSGYLSIPSFVSISAESLLSANGIVFAAPISGQVTLIGNSELIAIAIQLVNGQSILDGQANSLLNTLSFILANSFLYGNSDTQLSAINLVQSFSNLIGNGSLQLVGSNSLIASSILSGISELSLNGRNTTFSATSLEAQVYLLTSQYLVINAMNTMYGRGDLFLNSVLSIPAHTIFEGIGNIIATSFIQGLVNGNVTLFGGADTLFNAFSSVFGNDILSGMGELELSGLIGVLGNANLTGLSDFILNGYKINVAQASLIASGEIDLHAILSVLGHSTLEGLAFLIASGIIIPPTNIVSGEAILYGRGDLIATALNIISGHTIQSADATLSTWALVQVLANSILDGIGNTESNAVLLISAVAALYASGDIIAIGNIPAEILAVLTPLKRTFIIPAENRIYIVDMDGRVFAIKSENRNYEIEKEDRNIIINATRRNYDIED